MISLIDSSAVTPKHKSKSASGRNDNMSGAGFLEILALLLCIAGLCISTYLTIMHYSLLLGDLSLGKVCGGAEWMDCNSVIASRYGSILNIPVSLVGMWFYLCVCVLLIAIILLRTKEAADFTKALCWLAAAAVITDLYLGWVMLFEIKRLCTLCMATYIINIALLLIALRMRWRHRAEPGSLRSILPSLTVLVQPEEPMYYREVLKLFLISLVIGCILIVSTVAMIASSSIRKGQEEKLASLLDYLQEIEPFDILTEGRPAIGPEDADITIAIFSDFLCPQCQLASEYLDIVAANHRDSLRLVYFHFPLDAVCNEFVQGQSGQQHPGACELARAAQCAHRQGRFWEFHEIMFDGTASIAASALDAGHIKPKNMVEYATSSGLDLQEFAVCMAESPTKDMIKSDINLGHAVGVTATPTIFINGRPIIGALEPWMLEEAIKRIKSLPGDGVAAIAAH